MGRAMVEPRLSVSDFLRWDETQTLRHEFVDGEVFAMAGVEDRHATVAGNLYIALRQHLAGTPCRTFMTDVKLYAETANSYFYPDVFVTCHPADHASPLVKAHAKLVLEVLSPGTAAYDCGGKFARYRTIPELQEFAAIDIDNRRIDVHRKGADGLWVLHPFEDGELVHFASVDVTITADALFADVEPPAAIAGPKPDDAVTTATAVDA